VRVAFVISERREGLTSERLERYGQIERTLGHVVRADIGTYHYSELDTVAADATVLSGSSDPWALHDPAALERLRERLRDHEGPVLGICAGMQLLATAAGAEIGHAAKATGPSFEEIEVLDDADLLAGLDGGITVWQHHGDEVQALPPALRVLARSESCAVEALASSERPWWGTQFHPEAWDAEHPAGLRVLRNFFQLAGLPLR
jgi:GMP synthase (glutamine-hydrolysing)